MPFFAPMGLVEQLASYGGQAPFVKPPVRQPSRGGDKQAPNASMATIAKMLAFVKKAKEDSLI